VAAAVVTLMSGHWNDPSGLSITRAKATSYCSPGAGAMPCRRRMLPA